jgi:GTP-binding protein
MKFIDEAKIYVSGGRGGAGCVSFRREKFVPRGGPDGGDGGGGGDVILEVDAGRNTLLDLKGKRHFYGDNGVGGKGQGMTGRCGRSEVLRVPPGTVVRDEKTGERLADLVNAGERFIAAQGGRGGKGNIHFATSTNRAPRKAQPGEAGEERTIRLELKLLADVGLVGRPNAGKSTLISRISAARPKIADYPFTTLVPQLGVVDAGNYKSFTVADIPGLIEGAHEGAGMGIRFLKHIERTRLFFHLIDVSDPTQSDPWESFKNIQSELESFSPEFAGRAQWVVLTKADLHSDSKSFSKVKRMFEKKGYPTFVISAVTGAGIPELVHAAGKWVAENLAPHGP